MEMADIVDAELDGLDHVLFHLVEGGIELGFRRLDISRVDLGLVEIARKADECRIAFRADGFDDRLHLLDKTGEVGFRTLEQFGARCIVQFCQFVKRNIGHDRLLAGCGGDATGHFDLRKMSSPTSWSSRNMAAAAQAMKTTEMAARSGVMMDRIEL